MFDTHTHLNDEAFAGHVDEYIQSAKEVHVDEMAIVGVDAASNAKSLELSATYDGLYSVVGWHPTELSTYDEVLLEEQLAAPKVIGLGEIGLDYYWMDSSREEQLHYLERQIDIAKAYNLPIIFHTRSKQVDGDEAYQDLYQVLKVKHVHNGIIHSFNGNTLWAQRFEDLGLNISFSGVLTFKNAKATQEAAKVLRKETLLVETDAPYLAPVPYRGKQNEPAFVVKTVEKLAELCEVPFLEMAKQTTYNAHRLFGLEDKHEAY